MSIRSPRVMEGPYPPTPPPRPTYGDLGTWVSGRVLDPETWHLVSPQRKARGTVVRIYSQARNVVEILTDADELVHVRLPHRSAK